MLTSALPREGKTAVALSLAVAAASSGIRTLLIDASSSNPMLTQMLGRGEAGPRYRDQVVTDAQLGLSFLSSKTAAKIRAAACGPGNCKPSRTISS